MRACSGQRDITLNQGKCWEDGWYIAWSWVQLGTVLKLQQIFITRETEISPVTGVLLKKSSISWVRSSCCNLIIESSTFHVGGKGLFPEIHPLSIARDPSHGLFPIFLRFSRVGSSKERAAAIVRNLGARWLKMEMPATLSKRLRTLISKWPSDIEVTVEEAKHTCT